MGGFASRFCRETVSIKIPTSNFLTIFTVKLLIIRRAIRKSIYIFVLMKKMLSLLITNTCDAWKYASVPKTLYFLISWKNTVATRATRALFVSHTAQGANRVWRRQLFFWKIKLTLLIFFNDSEQTSKPYHGSILGIRWRMYSLLEIHKSFFFYIWRRWLVALLVYLVLRFQRQI